MLWACFAAGGLEAFVKTDGIMNCAKYKHISSACLCQQIQIIKLLFRLYQSSVTDQLRTMQSQNYFNAVSPVRMTSFLLNSSPPGSTETAIVPRHLVGISQMRD